MAISINVENAFNKIQHSMFQQSNKMEAFLYCYEIFTTNVSALLTVTSSNETWKLQQKDFC